MGTLARKDVDIWAVNILAKLVTIYNSSETGSEILLFQPTKFHKESFFQPTEQFNLKVKVKTCPLLHK